MSINKQKHILNFIREHENDEVKRSDIVVRFKHWHYHNGSKYISEILYRMICNGKLKKARFGYYKLGSGIKPEIVIENQLGLF